MPDNKKPEVPFAFVKEMTDRERNIYVGLKTVGSEIATFFSDAVKISNSDLQAKSYLLAHLAREIDGGYRDVFGVTSNKSILSAEKDGHRNSIQNALGLTEDSELSKQWHSISKQFNSFAHRHGAWKDPRDAKAFDVLWTQYIDILYRLVGNYYNIADSLDNITKLEVPKKEILATLPNLLDSEAKKVYFFAHLESRNWLEPLYRLNYFDPEKSPKPIEQPDQPGVYNIPQWSVLSYLTKVSLLNLEITREEDTKIFEKIISTATVARGALTPEEVNTFTDNGIFKIICCLPAANIQQAHFDFISEALDSKWESWISFNFEELLQRLIVLKNKSFLIEGFKILLKYKNIEEKQFRSIESVFKYNRLEELLSKYKEQLISIAGKELVDICLQKCSEILELDPMSFYDIVTIEESEQNVAPESYSSQIVFFIRESLLGLPNSEIKTLVKTLVLSQNVILRRIGFFTIGRRYLELSDILTTLSGNPLDDQASKHELFELFRLNTSQLTDQIVTIMLNWIDTITPVEGSTPENRAYHRKEWLTSIADTKHSEVLKRLDAAAKIYPAKIDHPGHNRWGSGFVGTTSPLTVNEIYSKSIAGLIEFFETFKPEQNAFFGPSLSGLEEAIIKCIRKKPTQFNINCEPIASSSRSFQNIWIRGLTEAWREEKLIFDTTQIFKVIREILDQPTFWESYLAKENHTKWFMMSLLSFLENGLNNDYQAFEHAHLPDIKEILLRIVTNTNREIDEYENLPMTAVNNVLGKAYISLFQYSLRRARIEESETDRWDKDVKSLLTSRIVSGQIDSLLFLVTGWFLPYIMAIDKAWVETSLHNVFPNSQKQNLISSLTGYFVFTNSFYNDVFILLKKEHIYFVALENVDSLSDAAVNHLVAQICIGYANALGGMSIEDPLMSKLLEIKKERIYSQVIYLFWSPRNPMDKQFEGQIKLLWRTLFMRSKGLREEGIDKFILSGCCKWINSLSSIDIEIAEFVKEGSRYIHERDFYALVDGLEKHISTQTEVIGNLLVEIFNCRMTYHTHHEKIISMVEKLYVKGFKIIGDRICILHADGNIFYLRDVYNKYNPK